MLHTVATTSNSQPKDAKTYPYLVDILNEVIDELATRLVVPLTVVSMKPTMVMKKLTPEINFDGRNYMFMTQQLTSIPKDKLKDPVGTLQSARELLIEAIDFAITGI